jgi:hypothetical protein
MPDDAVPYETEASHAVSADGDAAAWLRLAGDVGGRLDSRVGVSGTVGVTISGTSEGDAAVTIA